MNTNFNLQRVLIFIVVAACLSGCGRSLSFVPSTVVPGADGKVKVRKDKNRNYAVDLNIDNLADPGLLKTPKAYYVVWMETTDNGTVNLGRLNSSRSLFSKARRGSLQTVTPYHPLRFLVTAEDQADGQYPSSETVLASESNIHR
jgi:hypothetical protein